VAAFTWYKKASDRDHIEAQRRVAECYMNGLGVERNPTEAFNWYVKMTTQGDVEAQFQVGMYYYKGECVEHDLCHL
jgi:hypothetical protein